MNGESQESHVRDSVELIRRARDGDEVALDGLLRRYEDRLLRVVRIRLGSGLRRYLESGDILQEAMIVAFQKLPDFVPRSDGDLLGWFAAIAENRILDAQKHHGSLKRDPGPTEPIAADSSPPAAAEASPVEQAEIRETSELVDEVLSELPRDQRDVILQRNYLDQGWREVADALQRSIPAAQELHRRAWIRLRREVRRRLQRPT